ncbi:Holliday junction resolvase [Candidatus Pacearchaeota archaeon]|nr:Holliday junction resolvase [Candidatus Pacearchaeota archaeon]
MSNKAKGSNVERELVKIFTENGWRAVRVAGSGVGEESPCDLIVGKVGGRGYTVEVKSSRGNYIYIKKSQIEDFIVFSNILGLKAVLAVRFTFEGWLFLSPEQLEDSGKFFVVKREKAKLNGLKFGQFFEHDI